MSGHTPVPWCAVPAGRNMRDNYSQSMAIAGGADQNQLVAGCFSDVSGGAYQAKANAEYIALAANSYPALIEALGLAIEAFATAPGYSADVTFAAVWQWLEKKQAVEDAARAAIAAATGDA